MTNEKLQQNYSTFAEKYDQLFDPDMYNDWVAYVQKYVALGQVLDLGGGSGRLAILLAKLGYQVDVLDLSTDMLTLAQKHAEIEQVDVNLLQADMRDWSDWDKKYDAIVSFADALNYLPTLSDFKAAIAQIATHLKADGQFLFDVVTPYQVNVCYENYYYNNDEDEDNIFMWTSYPGDDVDSVDHDLKFFVYDEQIDGFKILREIHHEKTYELERYMHELELAGFKDIQVSADFGKSEINEKTTRWFFKAVKA